MAMLDPGGNIIEKYSYDAFGKPHITGWWDDNERGGSWYGNRYTFQGREWFPELGIYDYRNRYYHPNLGRFLQVDPTGFAAGDMNLFRYCGDDPVDRSDPMGLDTFENLPDAIRFARAQVVKLAFGPDAHKEYFKEFHDMKTHGVSIGISSHGGKFVTA